MKKAENEENNTTTTVNNPPHPLPTTVELCTLFTQYVFAYILHLNQAFKNSFIFNS